MSKQNNEIQELSITELVLIKLCQLGFSIDENKLKSLNLFDIFLLLGVSSKNTTECLSYAYNEKYGNWDDVNDLRKLDESNWMNPVLSDINEKLEGGQNLKILLIGANDGRELDDLLSKYINGNLITIVDVSSKAIEIARKRYSKKKNIEFFNGSFTDFLVIDKKFDLVISLRTIQSTGFNYKLIEKFSDLLNYSGLLILSVANGYIGKDSRVIKGMYDSKTNSINLKKPYLIVAETTSKLIKTNFSSFEVKKGLAEIFIIFKKNEK